jgi:plastocyanin
MRRTLVAMAAIGALGLVPAAASAHKYTAFAGNPGPAPSTVPDGTELNKFFPAKLKVHKGDKVKYLNFSAHTVSVLGKGVSYPPAAIADPTGAKYEGINDPNGQPFFFNGLTKFINNPLVFGKVGSTTVGDGATHSSGFFVPQGPGAAQYTLKFAKTGSYQVLCLLHPGMKQSVKVLKPKAKGASTDKQVKSNVRKQAKKGYQDAIKVAASTIAPNTVAAGLERNQATILAYFPKNLTVPAGTAVKFNLPAPSEVHNMVFGPPDYVQQFADATDKLPIFGQTENQISPPSIYGSEPAATPGAYTYTGSNYGNGFLWTPVMDDIAASPLPGSETITFTKAGTYNYFCAIHGTDMSGTIIVQ